MDVKDDFFDEPLQNEAPMSEFAEVPLPFPEKDYNKKGQLKKVRGRVLGKLLKCEFKYYLPIFCTVMALVLFSGVFFSFALRSYLAAMDTEAYYNASDREFFLTFFSGLLFVAGCTGGLLYAQIFPVLRYNKNFFQSEGYLTFSVPASVEEHVFAKRIAAIVISLATFFVVALTILFAVLVNGGLDNVIEIFKDLFGVTGVSGAFLGIELALSGLFGGLLMISLYAVVSCFLSKSSGKRKMGTTILLVFIGVGILESLLSYLLTFGEMFFPTTELGMHLFTCLTILVQAALTVVCTLVEIWYLKKKLDLK